MVNFITPYKLRHINIEYINRAQIHFLKHSQPVYRLPQDVGQLTPPQKNGHVRNSFSKQNQLLAPLKLKH